MAAANNRWRMEIVTYFCFTLPYALTPIGFIYVVRMVDGSPPLNIPGLVADGGILTIAIGLNAGAISRLIRSETWPELRIAIAGFTSLVMLFGSLFYGLRYARGAANSAVFVDLSVVIFIVSVVIATFSRFLPEDKR